MELSADTTEGRISLTDPIAVLGDERVSLDRERLAALPTEERTVTVACASGVRHTATWRGVPVTALLSEANVSDETTHLLVESADGYQICVDIYTALDGLLAFFRDGTPIAAHEPYETRFIAPDIDGARTVKAVAVLDARHLTPGTDPHTLETMAGTEEYSA
ncbi:MULTISPECIES: molybdopterin-dependent oxidoreductase [Haloferax]|uniref:Molybdopterin-dependent oxidoreductase n=2 Tax=Haloferax TaxID=2251 RepID=A0A6G1Z0H4_9EURY|nr:MULTISPECIES: molybdopterin-dependent oxidoreductase [Haloferax]KAB1187247.1 molybdopterin-dependent oxidoreductase [Haloferax sp. CBA1149]MRW79891.1 molybdopterin-dependent oxidoreductase [Haloferax marinisediminis]